MWTKDEPPEDGYYWAIRNTDFWEFRMEIVYVYTGLTDLFTKGMKFALCMNSDMGAQIFEFSWWKKIDMPVSPPEVSSYYTAPLYYKRERNGL